MFGKINFKRTLLFAIVILFVFLPVISARNFTVYNSSNPSITYFIINGDNGRIGIGTGNPQNTLNVIGDVNFTGTLYYGSLNGESNLNVNSSNYWDGLDTPSDILGSQINNDLNWINVSTANGSYVPYTGSNANVVLGDYNFSVGTSDLFVDASSGRVGIGTTNPGAKLDVNGTVTATAFSGNGSLLTNVNASNSVNLGGHPASFFMPLNKSVYGQYDFNGGWTSNGLSIIGGNIYAQQGYFYQINSLQVSNLEMNGSIIPDMDNQFDLGNSTNRWRDLNIGRNAVIGGTVSVTGDLSVNTTTFFVDASTGRVGIGTGNPQNTLNVVGDVNATTNLYGTIIYQNGNKVLDSLDNATIYNYIDSQDILYNNSMRSYVDAMNASQSNWTIENYVPYTGASKNVDLGSHNLSTETLSSNNVDTGKINVTGDAKITGSILLGNANITAKDNGDVDVW